MPWILVAESEGRFAERIRDGLAADGWQIEIAPTVADAERAAAAHPPEVVIVNAELAGAAAFVARCARITQLSFAVLYFEGVQRRPRQPTRRWP